MAEIKTRPNESDVIEFLNSVDHKKRREDGFVLLKMMGEVLGEEPKMWGPSIIGFGTYPLTYANGRVEDWMLVGFSPRKAKMSVYLVAGYEELFTDQLAKLGKYKTGKSCLYINKLEDVDQDVLKELIQKSAEHVAATNA